MRFALTDYEGALRRIEEMTETGERGYVCCTSVHGLIESRADAELRAALNGATLNLPDGMPIAWALNLLSEGRPLHDRVYGPTLMERACERAAARGASDLPLRGTRRERPAGAEDGAATPLAGDWRSPAPGAPRTASLTATSSVRSPSRIDESGAAIVWCGISTPRQEKWVARMRPRVKAPGPGQRRGCLRLPRRTRLASAQLDAAARSRVGLPAEPRAAPPRPPLSAQQSRLRRRCRPPVRARTP